MASAPAPNASISANGSFCAPSRTRPLEPTQIAPDCSTTGSNAAANPPVMGSLALPRLTRFETTTRLTVSSRYSTRVLTAIHQYGSRSPFQRNQTKVGHHKVGTRPIQGNNGVRGLACRRAGFVVEQARQPLAHIARRVEMTVDSLGPPPHRKCPAAEIRHDREYALVGDIVADENRP